MSFPMGLGGIVNAEFAGLDTPGWIASALDVFENARFFDESDVAGRVLTAAKSVEFPTAEEKLAADAECWAFNFHPQSPGELSMWQTHFGPAIVMGDFCTPDIAWIGPAVVRYWEKRMAGAKHPLLRALCGPRLGHVEAGVFTEAPHRRGENCDRRLCGRGRVGGLRQRDSGFRSP